MSKSQNYIVCVICVYCLLSKQESVPVGITASGQKSTRPPVQVTPIDVTYTITNYITYAVHIFLLTISPSGWTGHNLSQCNCYGGCV